MELPIKFSSRVWGLLDEDTRREVLAEFGCALRAQVSGKIEWTGELVRLVGLLMNSDATVSDVALFWVRLHGVLEFVADDGAADSVEPMNNVQKRLTEVAQDVRRKGVKLLHTFERDDLLLIEYERHRASHPFLDTYFLSFRGDSPALRIDRYCALVDEKVPLVEIRTVLNRFRERGGVASLAVTFARRIESVIRVYHAALTAIHELPREGVV